MPPTTRTRLQPFLTPTGAAATAETLRVCRTLPCQAASVRGRLRVCSSRHIRRMTRLARWRLWARRASRRVMPSAALRAR